VSISMVERVMHDWRVDVELVRHKAVDATVERLRELADSMDDRIYWQASHGITIPVDSSLGENLRSTLPSRLPIWQRDLEVMEKG